MTTGELTNDGETDLSINIGLGSVIQPLINVVYIMDISGSTAGSFGGGLTILDAQVGVRESYNRD